MVVLVPLQRQALALDGVGDEADAAIVRPRVLEGLDQAGQIVAAQVGHEVGEFAVAAPLDQRGHRALIAEIVEQALSPCRAALIGQGRVKLVRTAVDPVAQALTARLGERLLLQDAVLEDDDVPAERAEHRLEPLPQALADHRIEALAVVVDDPPGVADAMLPAFEHGFEDVAFVHLGIADERDHLAFGAILRPAVRLDIVLHEARKQRLRDAEADRTGREVDVVGILGARGIALRALVAAEVLEVFAGLPAHQVVDGMEDRRRMRLDGDAVFRTQHRKIQRRQDGRERRRRCLMAADLDAVVRRADVVGMMDHPGGEPERLALELGEDVQSRGG